MTGLIQSKKFDKDQIKQDIISNVKILYRRSIEEANPMEVYQAVSLTMQKLIIDGWMKTQKAYEEKDVKTVYYLSMEFLIGRALGNNIINLGVVKEVKEALDELGFDLNLIEDQERDPALGNGGLGRLAACFLDSLATLGYPAYGCGIRYHYGMFKQEIRDGYQIEVPDEWLKDGYQFELRRDEYQVEVKFGGHVRVEVKDGKNKFVQDDILLCSLFHMICQSLVMKMALSTHCVFGMLVLYLTSALSNLIREIIKRLLSRTILQRIFVRCSIQMIITMRVRSCA